MHMLSGSEAEEGKTVTSAPGEVQRYHGAPVAILLSCPFFGRLLEKWPDQKDRSVRTEMPGVDPPIPLDAQLPR